MGAYDVAFLRRRCSCGCRAAKVLFRPHDDRAFDVPSASLTSRRRSFTLAGDVFGGARRLKRYLSSENRSIMVRLLEVRSWYHIYSAAQSVSPYCQRIVTARSSLAHRRAARQVVPSTSHDFKLLSTAASPRRSASTGIRRFMCSTLAAMIQCSASTRQRRRSRSSIGNDWGQRRAVASSVKSTSRSAVLSVGRRLRRGVSVACAADILLLNNISEARVPTISRGNKPASREERHESPLSFQARPTSGPLPIRSNQAGSPPPQQASSRGRRYAVDDLADPKMLGLGLGDPRPVE